MILTNQGSRFLRRRAAAGNGLFNNLVYFYALNEAGGANNALDLHSNALHLTQQQSPGNAAGKVYASARTLNGSNQYFDRASESLLQAGDVDFTIAAWVNISSYAAYRAIAAKQASPTTQDYLLYLGDSQFVHWQFGNGGAEADPVSVRDTPGTGWVHIVAWHNAATHFVGLQCNARAPVLVDCGAKRPAVSTAAFNIGRRAAGDLFFNSAIGPVSMWKSPAGQGGVLSEAQRAALYNGGAGLPYASFTA